MLKMTRESSAKNFRRTFAENLIPGNVVNYLTLQILTNWLYFIAFYTLIPYQIYHKIVPFMREKKCNKSAKKLLKLLKLNTLKDTFWYYFVGGKCFNLCDHPSSPSIFLEITFQTKYSQIQFFYFLHDYGFDFLHNCDMNWGRSLFFGGMGGRIYLKCKIKIY